MPNTYLKTHLKVKIKSLAAESRIIRSEELKLKRSYPARKEIVPDGSTSGHHRYINRTDAETRRMKAASFRMVMLRAHRVNDVRQEARAALLAYAFIRGRSYRAAELNSCLGRDVCETHRLCRKAADIALRFGGFDMSVRGMAAKQREAKAAEVFELWMLGKEAAVAKAA
jgi:hypothetical protein